MPDIAVYGLGEMGADITRCIAGSGRELAAYDPVVDLSGELPGLRQCASAGEAAAGARVHLVVLKRLSDLQSLLFDDGALCASAPRGSLVVLHTTLTPQTVRELHTRVRDGYGHALIDAALSRRGGRVSEGSLSLFLGGSGADIAAARATLEVYADNIVHAGPTGAGMTVKLCNNWLLYSNRNAALQALRTGRELGVEIDVLRQALAASTGASWALAHYSELDEAIIAGRGAPAVARDRTASELGMAREMAASVGEPPTSLQEAFALIDAM
ncbi:NAD(P)-dependent oxidoreductase [Streptomyces sp. NPDC057654]|uniref:NAD(P)-dependent oxidoreductase n=1 Tax=Streptomyces sp. NPDC057654 TaxID=3346196 RepID=UPI00367F714C